MPDRMSPRDFHGSYLDFYPHYFEGVYPSGNFSWHHLWFLAYLLVFSLAALPLLLYLRGARPAWRRDGVMAAAGAADLHSWSRWR